MLSHLGGHQHGVSIQISINLEKTHIFLKKNCCDLNLGESLCIPTFFLFPDSGLNLLNDFDFLFGSILNGVTLKTTNGCLSAIDSILMMQWWFLNVFIISSLIIWQKNLHFALKLILEIQDRATIWTFWDADWPPDSLLFHTVEPNYGMT